MAIAQTTSIQHCSLHVNNQYQLPLGNILPFQPTTTCTTKQTARQQGGSAKRFILMHVFSHLSYAYFLNYCGK